MTQPSCMGGFACPVREKCARHVTDERAKPVEKLCNSKWREAFQPLVVYRKQREPA